MSQSQDYYEILRVSASATLEEIKKAFRHLARQYHPDLHPDNLEAQEQFKRICEAYEVLSNTVERQRYDRDAAPSKHSSRKASPYDFYVQGVEKALKKNYQGAIESYTQAIELHPQFVEAYGKRAEVRYRLGDDRGVLEDCRLALELDSQYAEAHYYRGRSRYRLGYSQAAIEAYSQALQWEPNYAPAYYYRGIAAHDLGNRPAAIRDLQAAMQLFREQGDSSGCDWARKTLNQLSQTRLRRTQRRVRAIAAATGKSGVLSLKMLFTLAFNPSGGLQGAFATLQKEEAIGVGVILAAIANTFFLLGTYIGWRDLFNFSIGDLMLVGWVPFASLVTIGAIARFIVRDRGSWGGDIFLAGATLVPIGFLALASGFSTRLGFPLMVMLTVFSSSHAVLILYHGYTQIAALSEAVAALLVPTAFLLSGLLAYWAFAALFLS